jgi:hypothetical protein
MRSVGGVDQRPDKRQCASVELTCLKEVEDGAVMLKGFIAKFTATKLRRC